MLDCDDLWIIVARVYTEGVLLGKDDIIPHFLLRAFGEAMGYYICCKHLPCVFSPIRSRVASTYETFGDGIYVKCRSFVVYL